MPPLLREKKTEHRKQKTTLNRLGFAVPGAHPDFAVSSSRLEGKELVQSCACLLIHSIINSKSTPAIQGDESVFL